MGLRKIKIENFDCSITSSYFGFYNDPTCSAKTCSDLFIQSCLRIASLVEALAA
jgi:hypothetical protein